MARKTREFETPPEDVDDEPDCDDDGLDGLESDDKAWDPALDEPDLDVDAEPSVDIALDDDTVLKEAASDDEDEEDSDREEHGAEELMFEEAPARKKKVKRKRASKAAPKPPSKTPAVESAAVLQRLWEAALSEAPDEPSAYTITEDYGVGHTIVHKSFGLGVVETVLGRNKVEVLFESGRRKLVTNFKR